MRFTVEHNFIFFPVNNSVVNKRVIFKQGEETVYALNVAIDLIAPTFYAKIDISRFMGKELEMTTDPQISVQPIFSDTDIRKANENDIYRPIVHFTPRFGWMNDPNGLIKYGDEYHMFFQHNPCSTGWDNMHWGHAVSKDLVRWEEKEVAVFPDKLGVAFSGSAIIDKENMLGLKEGEDDTVLLFYTSVGVPACQSIAYSTDGLKTFKKYSGNPVIPHKAACNRDPKIIWCEELNKYVIALYIEKDNYMLFTSSDLVNWKELQQIPISGDRECPDIFPLEDEQGKRKWVIIGANDKYIVGNFKNGKFSATQPIQSLHYGRSSYAAQSFSGLPDRRIVRMAWLRWSGFSSKDFCSQMTIPMEVTLKTDRGISYLAVNPAKELEGLFGNGNKFENISLSKEKSFEFSLKDTAYYISLSGAFDTETKLTLGYFGRKIEFLFDLNEIKAGEVSGPLSVSGDRLDVKLIIDRNCIEIFSDGGKVYYGNSDKYSVCDRNLPTLTLSCEGDYSLNALEIIPLDKIQTNEEM